MKFANILIVALCMIAVADAGVIINTAKNTGCALLGAFDTATGKAIGDVCQKYMYQGYQYDAFCQRTNFTAGPGVCPNYSSTSTPTFRVISNPTNPCNNCGTCCALFSDDATSTTTTTNAPA